MAVGRIRGSLPSYNEETFVRPVYGSSVVGKIKGPSADEIRVFNGGVTAEDCDPTERVDTEGLLGHYKKKGMEEIHAEEDRQLAEIVDEAKPLFERESYGKWKL